jgi:hypothetical protein
MEGGLTDGRQNESLNLIFGAYYTYGKIEHNLLLVGKGVKLISSSNLFS